MLVSIIIPFLPYNDKIKKQTSRCVESLLSDDVEILLISGNTFVDSVNNGLSRASGDYLFVVNNDTVAPPQWVELIETLDNNNVGIVCASEDVSPQYVHGRKNEYGEYTREKHDQFKGLDPRFSPYYFEDTDLLARIDKAGYEIVRSQSIRVYHAQSATLSIVENKNDIFERNKKLFLKKHGFDGVSYQH
jgi:GT2 family glycosyltransferase